MANAEQLAILKQGVEAWNRWRKEHPGVPPDLGGMTYLVGANLSRADLSYVDLSGARLEKADLSYADLSQACLEKANLSYANLGEANFRGANLRMAYLREANFRKADLRGANFSGVDLREANFSEANFSEANFSGVDLSGAPFRWANFSGVNFSGVNLSGVNLSGVDLWRVDFSKVNLSEARLENANLRNANLSRANLNGANLSGANLSGANFSEARLDNLRKANLSGANLSGADFRNLDLREIDLRKANLIGADLRVANLQRAILDEATLTDAKLWETLRAGWSIHGVICERAFWDEQATTLTEYAPDEFEKHHAEQQIIELHYQGGITRFELNTLPALLHHLENLHPDSSFRLKSVEDAPGGAKILIAVEEAGPGGFENLKNDALQLQAAQLELRDERRSRERLEIEKALLLNEVFPRILGENRQIAAAAATTVYVSAPVGSLVAGSSHVNVTTQQTITDVDALKRFVDEIFTQRNRLALPADTLARLESALQAIQEQLRVPQPNNSAIREGLHTVRNVLEGTAGSMIASAWWPTLSAFLQQLR